jgi:hypothetical protein
MWGRREILMWLWCSNLNEEDNLEDLDNRWDDGIKIYFEEIGWNEVDWMETNTSQGGLCSLD